MPMSLSTAGLPAAAWPFIVAILAPVYGFFQMPPLKSALTRVSGRLESVVIVVGQHSSHNIGIGNDVATFRIEGYPETFYNDWLWGSADDDFKRNVGSRVQLFYDPHVIGHRLIYGFMGPIETYGLTVNGITVQSIDAARARDWGDASFLGPGLSLIAILVGIWKYRMAVLASPRKQRPESQPGL